MSCHQNARSNQNTQIASMLSKNVAKSKHKRMTLTDKINEEENKFWIRLLPFSFELSVFPSASKNTD
jgi:hypothetical protein